VPKEANRGEVGPSYGRSGNNIMDILWEPETGTCTECGEGGCTVRRYSSCGRSRTFCFPCWNGAQEPYLMSSAEWTDDDRVTFSESGGLFPDQETPSRAA
jgi:hypothetical protein